MLDKDTIIVLDDVISPAFQDYLEKLLIAGDCEWFFSADVAHDDDFIKKMGLPSRFGFSKTYFSAATGRQSPLFATILPMVFEACAKINFVPEATLFSRSFMTIPLPGEVNSIDHIHVDTADEHLVCLYYVNDSDGDTVIYDKTLDDFITDPAIIEKIESVDYSQPGVPTIFQIIDENVDKGDWKIIKRVTPKKGRMLFFNGHRYHSSSRPSTGYRIVINNCVKGHFTK